MFPGGPNGTNRGGRHREGADLAAIPNFEDVVAAGIGHDEARTGDSEAVRIRVHSGRLGIGRDLVSCKVLLEGDVVEEAEADQPSEPRADRSQLRPLRRIRAQADDAGRLPAIVEHDVVYAGRFRAFARLSGRRSE